MKWDAFISYAGKDKTDIAEPLANKLALLGYKVWFAENELEVGDSLRAKIDEGLANSRYGIVILSPIFFSKHWPQKELDGLLTIESFRGKVILPILHGMELEELVHHSPMLASKIFLSTKDGIENVAEKLSCIFSKADFYIPIDKESLQTLVSARLKEAIENYFDLLSSKREITIKVLVDYSILSNNLFPRLNEYKGERFSDNAPQKDYEEVVSRTNRIFDNISYLIQYFLSTYAQSISHEEVLRETIQKFCKLCLFNVYEDASRLLPLGEVEDWFITEFLPIWDILCLSTKIQENETHADSAMTANLLGFNSKITILDLVGRKGIESVTRIAVPVTVLSTELLEMLGMSAFVAPDSEITLNDWLSIWLPQILAFRAINAAYYKVDLAKVKANIGLLKADYFRMGYH